MYTARCINIRYSCSKVLDGLPDLHLTSRNRSLSAFTLSQAIRAGLTAKIVTTSPKEILMGKKQECWILGWLHREAVGVCRLQRL